MNRKKLIIGIVLLVVVALIVVGVFIFINNNNKVKKINDMSFDENLASIQNGRYMSFDDFGKSTNISEAIKGEKELNENIVMYNIQIYGDSQNSIIKFKMRNNGKEKVEAFKYNIQFIDDEDYVIDNIMFLDGQEMPGESEYNVTINVKGDIVNVYDIEPIISYIENEENLE